MGKRHLRHALTALRESWDRRALENALFYVATGRRDWTREEFFASGRRTIEHFVLTDTENICQGLNPSSMRILEIGCGAGRVTRALAQYFGEVHAVDISAEMVRLAREALAPFPNTHVYQNNGMDLSVLPALEFDFAFSTIVFQHIPSRDIIESYFREVNRLLRPGALFKLEVHGTTEPKRSAIRRIAAAGLRILVPSRRRRQQAERTWLGMTVTPEDARRLADATGFELRYQHGSQEQNYWLWLFKRALSN